MNWYDKAQQELDEDHENGLLTDKEYMQAMSDLAKEYRQAAHDAAQETFDSFY